MAPVDYVAKVISAAATTNHDSSSVRVAQISGRQRMQWVSFLGCLETYGYTTPEVAYRDWSNSLEQHVAYNGDHALYVQKRLPCTLTLLR